MVLFDEDPVTLISETTNQFHIAPDRDSLSRIGDSLTSLSGARQSRLDHHHTLLKSLSRRLNGLQEGRRWEEDRHDAGSHAERMLKMDTEKFRIAKGVSDVEIEGERLEGELSSLQQQLEVLEREGPEGGRRANHEGEDEVMYVIWALACDRDLWSGVVLTFNLSYRLKLQTYRSLGISVIQDSNTAEFNRAIVRRCRPRDRSTGSSLNRAKEDVNVINIDGSMSRSFYTSMFWDAL